MGKGKEIERQENRENSSKLQFSLFCCIEKFVPHKFYVYRTNIRQTLVLFVGICYTSFKKSKLQRKDFDKKQYKITKTMENNEKR